MKILILLTMPYVPLAPLAVPDGAALQIETETLSGGWVSSRGSAGDHAPGGPSSPFTRAAVRERARGWEVRRLGGCGWRLLMTGRCAVRADIPIDDLRATGVHADAFVESIERTLEGDSKGVRFSVRVFKDRHAFDVYASIAGAKGADSFYDPRGAEAVLFWPARRSPQGTGPTEAGEGGLVPRLVLRSLASAHGVARDGEGGSLSNASGETPDGEGGSDNAPPWRLLMHELAHAYLDRVFNRREPLWLAEGLAEYFASYEVADGRIAPGGRHDAASARLKSSLQDGTFVPLRKLLAARRDAFYAEAHALHYAESWALLKFLAENDCEDHPRVLWELVRGKGLHLVWDLKDLERCWIESIRNSR